MPPLRSLPRDVKVPMLPGLGLSWYEHHGASYWIRRAAMSVLWTFVTALWTLIAVAILIAYYHRSLAAFYVVLGVEIAYSLAVLAYFAVVTARHWNDPDVGARLFSPSRRARAAPARKGGARMLHIMEQVFVALSFLTFGLYLTMLLMSLLPETPAERRARLFVAEELRRRGLLLPDS